MTTVKFVHTADWQLGMRRHFLSDEALPRFMQARVDVIRTIAKLVTENGCQFVVVSGDVWESNQLDRLTVGRALEALGEVPCPVFLLPGNHDPLDAASIYGTSSFTEKRPSNVQVFDSDLPVEVVPNVEVLGLPWPTKHVRRDLMAAACDRLEPAPGKLRVCVAHGMVDSLSPDKDDPALISEAVMNAAIADGRLHYVALGDRHSTTQVSDRVWYAGSPEPTDYTEKDSGNVLLVELSEDGCTTTPHRTGKWRFVREELTFSSIEDVAAARERLNSMPDKAVTILKLTLKGSLNLAAKAELDALLEEVGHLFGALEIWDRHTDLVVLPNELDREKLGLSGFARATVDELHSIANSESEDAATAQNALTLLYAISMRVQP